MGLKSAVGGAFGYLCLAVALGATLWGLWLLGETLWRGVTEVRLFATMVAFGCAVTFGFFGYFVRKAVAGQILPMDVDRSVAYRGGR
ncbi:hypothetical protein SAMN04488063_0499 [Halopelagius inordinatus]|uniref:Uncharacterized protein n=2 Tax=Halopelagius inordinatus TaxID=553467 RepID=A0A1I2M5C8_9EURY|nr:hypothetical protein SAMN04488063_0499 [Halopelagius inordinatus]